jgi:hypothetical protein
MLTEQVDPFHGDKENENPEDFLRSFFRCLGTANDDVKKKQFKYFLQADSATDKWFEELQDGDKKDGIQSKTRLTNVGQGRKQRRRRRSSMRRK